MLSIPTRFQEACRPGRSRAAGCQPVFTAASRQESFRLPHLVIKSSCWLPCCCYWAIAFLMLPQYPIGQCSHNLSAMPCPVRKYMLTSKPTIDASCPSGGVALVALRQKRGCKVINPLEGTYDPLISPIWSAQAAAALPLTSHSPGIDFEFSFLRSTS